MTWEDFCNTYEVEYNVENDAAENATMLRIRDVFGADGWEENNSTKEKNAKWIRKEYYAKVLLANYPSFNKKGKYRSAYLGLADDDYQMLEYDGVPINLHHGNQNYEYVDNMWQKITVNIKSYKTVRTGEVVRNVFVTKSINAETTTEEHEDTMDFIKNSMQRAGYQCNKNVLAQFLCAMDTNQIIILHGAPGMGKTTFVERIADALSAKVKIVPVRPNWVDNQDLMGFYNPVDHRYCPTPFLEALCEAKECEENNQKFFICLDEMNLAYIEQYFSDVLSAMQSKKPIELYSQRDAAEAKARCEMILSENSGASAIERFDAQQVLENLKRYPAKFQLPSNIQFVGTLNMDATTKELSPKVIDRSFIIEVDGDSSYAVSCNDLEWMSGFINDNMRELFNNLNISESKRMKEQYKAMRGNRRIRSGQSLDYYFACKVLPMIATERMDDATIDLVKRFLDDSDVKRNLPLFHKTLKRMYDEENNILNYWRMRR